MQIETIDVSWFISSAYGAALGIVCVFFLTTLWRRFRAKAALKRLERSIES